MRTLKNNSALVTLLLFTLTINLSKAQNIYTIAGNGTIGYSGDGGLGTNAEIDLPYCVATDMKGNVYIADLGNSVIRKIDTHDSISTIAGNGTAGFAGDGGQATAAELNHPDYVFVDKSGNIYIADYDNGRIRIVNTSGIISTIAGNGSSYSGDGGPATAAGVSLPGGVTVDNLGNVYIGEYYDNRIRMINSSGIINTIVGNGSAAFSGDGGQASAAEINAASGIWVDTSGNIYIADCGNNRIRKVNSSGVISTIAGNGTPGFGGDGGAATAAELNAPGNIAIDRSGNMYICDENNNRIRKVDASGIISTVAGNGTAGFSGDGGAATAAELNSPHELAVNSSGNVFFADRSNDRIREIVIGSEQAVNDLKIESEMVTVYPNPSNGTFTIEEQGTSNKGYIEVYNMLGEKICTTKLYSTTTHIDLSSNLSGIYLYSVLTETGNLISSGKFIIQK